MKNIFVFFILLASAFTVTAQESFSSVEERMTGKEFMETGLSKLTDAELEALNNWLRGHSVATLDSRTGPAQQAAGSSSQASSTTVAVSSSVDERGFEGRDNDRSTIV